MRFPVDTLATAVQASALLLLCSCSQREVPCSVGRSLPYAAKYKPISLQGLCDGAVVAELGGDQIGLTAYNTVGVNGLPDTSKIQVAIRTAFMGAPTAAAAERGVVDPGGAAAAIGPFSSDVPDENGLCIAKTLAPTTQVLPALDADADNELEAQPARAMTEIWSDVSVYVDASALGTQMTGTYTVTEAACSASYQVMAVYPATDCTGADGAADDSVCQAVEAGISPDFPVVCDPALLLCVLDADVDAALPIFKP